MHSNKGSILHWKPFPLWRTTPWSVSPLPDCQFSLHLEEFNKFQTSAPENETELSQGVQKLLVKTKGERGGGREETAKTRDTGDDLITLLSLRNHENVIGAAQP